ncbi:MAG TPA: T9SS type A sorting domain-containing protein [Rubricoccaceae bacterium]|nr:T9SS type A sorting domain-containing protein [Rubricoccaceae bacterium]
MHTRFFSILAGLLIIAEPVGAQPFFDAPWRAFETDDRPQGHFAVNLTAADLNGDGLPDAVVAQNVFFPGVRVMLNQGAGAGEPATFPDEGTFYALSHGSWDVVARDFDGDGDLDLASSNTNLNYQGATVAFLRNNGDGTFQAPQTFAAGAPSTGITAGDFDGDGDQDVALANYGSFGQGTTVSVLLNSGGGAFAAPVSYPVGAGPNDIEAGDLDEDGDVDLATAHESTGGFVSVLRNNGSGTFGAATVYQNLFSGTGPPEMALANPDGDGDLDLVLVGYFDQNVNEARLVLLRNNGNGALTPELVSYGHLYEDVGRGIAVANLDGDSRDDVVVTQYFESGHYVFRDNDAGSLLPAQRYAGVPNPIGIDAADLDGDGDDDVLMTSRIERLLTAHENVGNGAFPERPIYGRGVTHNVLELGDVDGDGDLDGVTSHGGASSSDIAVYLNDGTGAFVQSQRVAGARAFAKLRDLDGDGVLDLLYVSAPTAPPYDFFVARGNGNGTFQTPVRWPVGACGIAHPNAFDLDEDGDLDVVNTENAGCIGGGGGRRVFISRNNGDGTFQTPLAFEVGTFPYNTTAGDFNEDGHLDLATASQGIAAIAFGNGDGTFQQPAPFLPSGELGANILTLDLDSDGHLDLVTLRDYSPDGSAGSESELVLLFGNGTGAFIEQAYPEHLTQDFREWLASGDVDGDGDVDLMVGGSNDALVFLHDGGRTFTFSGRYGVGEGGGALHYAEVTGDMHGDLVALVAHETPPFGGEVGIAVVPGLTGMPTGNEPGGDPESPSSFALSAVYPNPFNPLARFTLEVDAPQRVTLALYDALGREVATLHDGRMEAGTHAFALDGGALPSGLYLLRATGETVSVTRSAVLLK